MHFDRVLELEMILVGLGLRPVDMDEDEWSEAIDRARCLRLTRRVICNSALKAPR
jgi:hypothetical protein